MNIRIKKGVSRFEPGSTINIAGKRWVVRSVTAELEPAPPKQKIEIPFDIRKLFDQFNDLFNV